MNEYLKKLIAIYPKSKKIVFFNVLILNFLNTCLEVFNLALVLPLFSVILEKTDQLRTINIIPEFFYSFNQYEQIIIVIISI